MNYHDYASLHNYKSRVEAQTRKTIKVAVLAGVIIGGFILWGSYHTTNVCPSQDPQTECLW